jgi:hypothetical protein
VNYRVTRAGLARARRRLSRPFPGTVALFSSRQRVIAVRATCHFRRSRIQALPPVSWGETRSRDSTHSSRVCSSLLPFARYQAAVALERARQDEDPMGFSRFVFCNLFASLGAEGIGGGEAGACNPRSAVSPLRFAHASSPFVCLHTSTAPEAVTYQPNLWFWRDSHSLAVCTDVTSSPSSPTTVLQTSFSSPRSNTLSQHVASYVRLALPPLHL